MLSLNGLISLNGVNQKRKACIQVNFQVGGRLRIQGLAASANLPKPAHVIHPHAYPLLYHAPSSAPRVEACVVGIRSKQSPQKNKGKSAPSTLYRAVWSRLTHRQRSARTSSPLGVPWTVREFSPSTTQLLCATRRVRGVDGSSMAALSMVVTWFRVKGSFFIPLSLR